jgi:DNA translocase FtsK/SpoIIIE-like protein
MAEPQRVVAAPVLWQEPPPTLRPAASESRWQRVVVLVLRPLWSLRVEIAVVLVLGLMWAAVASDLGVSWTAVFAVGCTSLGARSAGLRRWVRGVFHRARLRRQWMVAVRYAGLATINDRVPKAVSIRAVAAGDEVRVRVPAGSNVSLVAERAETIAAFLEVQDVRVARDRDNARWATVSVVRCDPLSGQEAVAWPWVDAGQLSLWEAVPVGITESGELATVVLPGHSMAIGGEPGGGKSNAESVIVATAALDPSVRLWLLDGKEGVEFAQWRGCAHRFVTSDLDEAIAVLGEARDEMEARYRYLLDTGKRKVEREDGLGLELVVVDELAVYLAAERKESKEFAWLLRDLVARGRAAGVIVVAATQKPSADVVPTSLRDLMGYRWAFRCSTPQASDTILGQGWASQGWSATAVDAADRGVGYLLHEGGRPVHVKACYLSDSDLASIACRAEALRRGSVLRVVDPLEASS